MEVEDMKIYMIDIQATKGLLSYAYYLDDLKNQATSIILNDL